MKKPLPIGVADYRRLREDGYYFVDKSLMIQDLLEKKTIVTLITRPAQSSRAAAPFPLCFPSILLSS